MRIGQLPNDGVEKARSAALYAAILLALLSLIQLAVDRSTMITRDREQAAAVHVARQFVEALSTYDYAHPEVQVEHLRSVASEDVVARVVDATGELRAIEASAIGEAGKSWVAEFTPGESAAVVVEVHEIVTNSYVGVGRQLHGLVQCVVGRSRGNWSVQAYEWVLMPAPPAAPSQAR